jgi:hypothetical protein
MQILHGNYVSELQSRGERSEFKVNVDEALSEITPEVCHQLISGGWRESITGSWFAGLKQFRECQSAIGELLLASKFCFAGQSHAFAMACFATEHSAEYLRRYLQKFLRKPECHYDQGWAMAALMWIDNQRSTEFAEEFLLPGGLWDEFAGQTGGALDEYKSDFWKVMECCNRHFGAQPILADNQALDENQVTDIVCADLESRGFQILQRLTTTQQGIDIKALNEHTGETLLIEAKGGTSSKVGSKRYGKPFTSNQVFDRVAKGFYTAAQTSTSLAETERSVLAVPDTLLFRKYVNQIAQPAKVLGLVIYLVSIEHGVIEFDE